MVINLRKNLEAFPFPREYQWRKNGADVVNSSNVMFGYPAMSILNISRSDSDRYTLMATNYRLDDPEQMIGTGDGSVQLNVLCKKIIVIESWDVSISPHFGDILKSPIYLYTDGPELVKGPSVVAVALDTSAKLMCGENLVSRPEPTITWRDNNGAVVNPASTRFSQDDGPSLLSLTITGVTMGDAGSWVCVVTVENVGMTEHSINLIVVGKRILS